MAKSMRIGDEAGVAARDKDIKNLEASLDLALRDIMETGMGRAWIWDLLSKCHVFSSPMREDFAKTSFCCGEQNVGLQVMAQIHRVCPERYAEAMREKHND